MGTLSIITAAFIIILIACVLLAGLFRRLELGLLGILFLLPFERIPSFDIGGVTLKLNHLFGASVIFVWLLTVLAGRRPIKANPLILPLLLFTTSLFLSISVATDSHRALLTVIAISFSFALCLLIPQLLIREQQIPPLLNVLALTTVIATGFGFYQFFGDLLGLSTHWTGLDPGYTKVIFGFPRIQSFSQEPLYFGNFLLLPISLGLALLTLTKPVWPRPVLLAALTLVGLAFIFTLSRGAYLGLLASLVVLLVLVGRHLLRPKLILPGLAALLVIGFLIVGVLRQVSPTALTTFAEHVSLQDFGKGESTVGRLASWYQALGLWQLSPWIGIGSGNFGPATLNYPAETPPHGWPIVNNQYVETLVETGLLGLTTFLIFFIVLLMRSLMLLSKLPRGELIYASLAGTTAAVIGILAQYNFFSTLYINPIWIIVGLVIGLQNIAATTVVEETGAGAGEKGES